LLSNTENHLCEFFQKNPKELKAARSSSGTTGRGDDAFGVSSDIATIYRYLKEQCAKQNIKMPFEVFLAMTNLAGVFDTIQDEVVVGGRIIKEDISGELRATILQPPSKTEQTND
jgi:hypothetical protein